MLPPPPTYRELQAAYKKAEDAIHDLGLDTGEGADLPAVNELRYAGNHILKAIVAQDDGDLTDRNDQMVRALRHCERALYDAYDGAVFFRLAQFHDFKHDYASVVITEIVPDYTEIVRRIRRARDKLRDARQESRDRPTFYQAVIDCYPQLERDVESLESARDELNKVIRKQQKDARAKWLSPISIVTSAIIAALTTLAVAFGWFSFFPPDDPPAISQHERETVD